MKSGRRDFLAKTFGIFAATALTLPTRPTQAGFFDPSARIDLGFKGIALNREIWLRRVATQEVERFALWKPDGHIDYDGYLKFCWFLRDVQANKVAQMNLDLARLVTVQQGFFFHHGIDRPIDVLSGYRSFVTNVKTEGAAEDSDHLYGEALDERIEGIPVDYLGRLLRMLELGSIGYYRTFLHAGVRGVPRQWYAPSARAKG